MAFPIPAIGFIDGLGTPELVMVLFVTVLLFGREKLPELARGLGKALREFRKASGAVQSELKRAMDEVEEPEPRQIIRPKALVKPSGPPKSDAENPPARD